MILYWKRLRKMQQEMCTKQLTRLVITAAIGIMSEYWLIVYSRNRYQCQHHKITSCLGSFLISLLSSFVSSSFDSSASKFSCVNSLSFTWMSSSSLSVRSTPGFSPSTTLFVSIAWSSIFSFSSFFWSSGFHLRYSLSEPLNSF